MNTKKIFAIAVAGTLFVWIAWSVLPRFWMGYPPPKTPSARQAFEPVAAEPAMTAPTSSCLAPISRPIVNAEDRIDQEYAERLYDVRFAIAARYEGYRPSFPFEPIEALEERRDALIAELVAKKAEVRKKRLGEKPAAAETEPKR